jgi:tRNA G18 (ribose-2'-O)-methylase SpoU
MVQLTLLLHNIRSAHNVGAILRSCDSVGVSRVIACGITPYPPLPNDGRDPVVRKRLERAIAKTALGAQHSLSIEHFDDTLMAVASLRQNGCTIYGLEQASGSADILTFRPHSPTALIVGNELTGLPAQVLAACDTVLEIPQRGRKESLNVAVAAGIALYALLFP